LHQAARRVYPLTFAAKVFGDFFFVFEKICAQQSFLNKVTFGADGVGIVHERSFPKSFKCDSVC
jgi:hypothetical protein